jgi:serine/threonine-protein kinase
MGIVVAAHLSQHDEKVALKFLLPDALGNSEAVARFAREARAAVKIKSEHVARVMNVGTLPNGAPYMVMEYLDGEDLAAWIQDRGPLPIEQAVEFVLQACEALAEAHALGIVHRDLKPANLFCIRRADGRLAIKVLDFGISKMTQIGGSGLSAMTHATGTMGSPMYMSPEQMRSAKTVDSISDIWAIGVVLFELLAGKSPFFTDSLPELVLRITTEPPSPLRDIRPEVPVGLEAVIRRCLEKERERRYPNVAELALALLPFAPKRGRGSVERISGIIHAAGLSATAPATPRSPQNAGTVVPGVRTSPPVSQTTRDALRVTSRRGTVVGIAVASILVLGGGGAFLVRRGRGVRPAASPSVTEVAVQPAPPPPLETRVPPAPADATSAAPVAEAGPPTQPLAPARPVSRSFSPSPAPVAPTNLVARPTGATRPTTPPLPSPPTGPKSYDHM